MEPSNKSYVVLALLAVVLAAVSLFTVYLSAYSFVTQLTGYASSIGEANLTVENAVVINFTTSHISWGQGRVNSGYSSAGLNTFETNNVTNGNWTLQTSGGLRIQNIGNVNVSLNLSGTKTAAQMIGGTGPSYSWNITNVKTDSCRNDTGLNGTLNIPFNRFYNVNTTTTEICRFLQSNDSQDTIRIDFNLTVPSDSFTGSLGDTITATAFPSPY